MYIHIPLKKKLFPTSIVYLDAEQQENKLWWPVLYCLTQHCLCFLKFITACNFITNFRIYKNSSLDHSLALSFINVGEKNERKRVNGALSLAT